MTQQRDEEYVAHRSLVVRLAYDITGSWSDAEDVAQQAYLRFRDASADIRNPRAYLARIATNLALDAVACAGRYVGPDLPQPVPTGPGADEALMDAAEVEIALMVVLKSLTPYERAVFLLHDVFSFSHAEIASMLERDPASVRQTNARARNHIEARRPLAAVSDADLAALVGRFSDAVQHGDVDALVTMLVDDAVFVGDGGGKVPATRREVVGADKIARLLVGLASGVEAAAQLTAVRANGRPAFALSLGGVLDSLWWILPAQDGRVAQILAVRNPDKLSEITPDVLNPRTRD